MKITPKLTKRQAAIIGLYTGITCGSFADIQELAEELVGGPVFTHEFATEKMAERLKELAKPLFLQICHRD